MKLNKLMGAGLLALLPGMAVAQGIGNTVDVYYISAGLDVDVGFGSADDDGDGFGVKGNFAFADNLFFSGEYQAVEYDDSGLDIDQLRLGVGYNAKLSEQAQFYGLAEFARIKLSGGGGSDSDNGYGLHAGVSFDVTPAFSLDGRVGYVDIGDLDGVEFLVGAGYAFTETFGLFIDYRLSQLSGGGVDLDLDDLRAGARFTF